MKHLLKAFIYGAGGFLCIAGACSSYYGSAVEIGLFAVGMFFILPTLGLLSQGVSKLLNKRKMQQTAQRAAWNALQASGKE